jgi:hypothetical protein
MDEKVIFKFGRGEEVLIFLKPRMVTKSVASCKVAGTKTSSFWLFATLF